MKESDSGLYVCRAENRAGQAETTAHIVVKDYRGERPPLKFIHAPYNLEVPAGSTIEMPCKADGEPAPVIVWRKDGNLIQESRSHMRLSPVGSLYIRNVSFQDAGVYECSAVNDFGKVTANGVLKVKGTFLIFFLNFSINQYSDKLNLQRSRLPVRVMIL